MAFFPQGVLLRWALAISSYLQMYRIQRIFLPLFAGLTTLLILLEYYPLLGAIPKWLFLNVIMAPWIEEMIYRGPFLDRCRTIWRAPVVPILISTCLFSIAHYLSNNLSLIQILAGLLLGSIYWRWRSLLFCTLLHGLGNLLLFLHFWWQGGRL